MKRDDIPVIQAEALVVPATPEPHQGSGERRTAEPCRLCGGPRRLCGGSRRCAGGGSIAHDLRWLTAIRATYAGLLLTPTPASLWGGALLRLAGLVIRGRPPSGSTVLAALADPGAAVSARQAERLAVAYLEQGDLGQLRQLDAALRDRELAPWLEDLWSEGVRAALATPLEARRFDLFAVACEACTIRGLALVEDVDTFDAAIRCPHCEMVYSHPLKTGIGEPHAVGRCLKAPRPGQRCMAHNGADLDAEGLCVEGRATMDKALVEAAAMVSNARPFDRALMDAVVRAQRAAKMVQIDAAAAGFVGKIEAAQAAPGGIEALVEGVLTTVEDAFKNLHSDVRGALDHLTGKKSKAKGKKLKVLPGGKGRGRGKGAS